MVELKDYQIEIAKQFAQYRNNPIIFDNGYDKVPNPFTLKDAEEFIAIQLKKTSAQRKLIYWKDIFVGEIGIDIKKDVFRLSAEMGYFIGEPFWGNGISTKAIALMTDYVFNTFDIVRIEAGVFEFNKPSMRVLEKNDFTLESIKKKAAFKNGKLIDDYLWVKLKEDSEK
ncbi:GNAT family N-acetyltransferase [Zobellia uliginosa]|uniref:GNAT family N-acetyltransferase n=1 Tax=Zobellia uliginosa TaxID=143224 RepID=UPI001C074CC7|nr:GNAT family protein [Zobellia uliginosa]MBU2948673.1 GNAT family N-acetyltransferase [Zobellia uliginosa]